MTPENVSKVIDDLVGFILRYAVTLAAISALSMALIEMAKALVSWRDRFHKRLVVRWVNNVTVAAPVFQALGVAPATFRQRVFEQLIELTTGESVGPDAMAQPIEWKPWDVSPGNALFAMELEKMLGQIQSAADMALSNPNLYPELYLLLTSGAAQTDIINWYGWAQQPPVSTTADAALAKKQADTYARLRQFIRRRLDAVQLTAAYRWQTGNQVASVALGAVLLFGSMAYLTGGKPQNLTGGWLGLVLVSLMGGVMAPVAKDLVMALKKARSGG